MKLQSGDTLAELLRRAGASRSDSERAELLVHRTLASAPPIGSDVAIVLGIQEASGRLTLERATVRTDLNLRLTVLRDARGDLQLQREDIAVNSSPLRLSGRTGDSLYWSLRARGVQPDVAEEYLATLAGRMDIARDLGPDDRFDLVLARRRAATGESEAGPLLYAAIDRRSGRDVQLVRWTVAGRSAWVDASAAQVPSEDSWTMPVAGRVSSVFGVRHHPILRFVRFHRGVDISAPWGAPIVAAIDGTVIGAGWNGGHGRQVRITHGDGVETAYSHMSGIEVKPGARVRRGQVIGYVGSTGLSTGPHVHYEVHRNGRPVDPMAANHPSTAAPGPAAMVHIRARLRQLLAIPTA